MAGFKLLKKKRDALKAKFQVWTPNRKTAAEIVRCGKVTKTNTHIFNFSWLVIYVVEIIMVFVAIIAMMAASPHRYR